MRTWEAIAADARRDKRPFSNSSEYEMWADHGRGCYDCINDDSTDQGCPILGVAVVLGLWPVEWTRGRVEFTTVDGAASYREYVDACTDFEHRRDDDDDPDDQPDPPPPPECDGQIDIFEVAVDLALADMALSHPHLERELSNA